MKPQNQTGAISVVLAVLFLAISAVGISFGLKAVNTPTNLLSKAATCATFAGVSANPSPVSASQDFTCNATLDPLFTNSRTIVCGWTNPNVASGWPQTGGRWFNPTCNGVNCSFGIKMDNTLRDGNYELVAFDNQSGCGPSSGKRVPLNVNRPNISPTSPPQPTAPPGQPTQPPPASGGRCFYLTAEFSLTGEGNYDASVNFNTDDTAVDYHDIQLQKNGVFVAGWNKWTRPSPFTYYPQWTGGRVNRGTSVTYSGIDDVCGLRGNRASISCTINNDGTVSGSGCSLAGGNQPQPTTAPTAIPTVPVGGPTQAPGVNRCNFEVTVNEKNLQPIPLANASVSDRSRGFVPILKTDSSGKTTFANIEKYSNFNLQVTKNGYADYFEIVNLNTSCSKTVELTPLGTNPIPTATTGPAQPPTPTPPIPTPKPGTVNLKVILGDQLNPLFKLCADKLALYLEVRTANLNSFLDTYNFGFKFLDDPTVTGITTVTFPSIPIPVPNDQGEHIKIFLRGVFLPIPTETPFPYTSFYLPTSLIQTVSEIKSGETYQVNFTPGESDLINKDILKEKCPAFFPPVESQSLPQRVAQAIQNIGNIFNKNENVAVKTGAKGKVVVRNSLTSPIEAVYITLHRDQNDNEGFYNQKLAGNSKGEYLFNLENTSDQTANPPLVKAWVRSTDGSWYQNRACKLSGDNFDCFVKNGDNKTLYVDIGPQGLQKLNSDMQKTSQTATENISKLLDTVPLGQYVKMFIISAF